VAEEHVALKFVFSENGFQSNHKMQALTVRASHPFDVEKLLNLQKEIKQSMK
jgi:hypothetical protein